MLHIKITLFRPFVIIIMIIAGITCVPSASDIIKLFISDFVGRILKDVRKFVIDLREKANMEHISDMQQNNNTA